MNRFVRFLLILLSFTACKKVSQSADSSALIFPENTQIIYQINQKSHFLSAIENNEFWKANSPKALSKSDVEVLKLLPDQERIWLAYTDENVFFITDTLPKIDSLRILKNANLETHTFQIEKKEWFYTTLNHRLVVSSLPVGNDFFESAVSENQTVLKPLRQTADLGSVANIFIKKERISDYFKKMFRNDITRFFSQWVALDLFLEEDNVRLSGTAIMDVKPDSKDVLAFTQPYQSQAWQWLPHSVSELTAYTFADAENMSFPDSLSVSFSKTLNGVAFAKFEGENVALVSSYDALETLRLLPVLSEDLQSSFSLYELSEDHSMNMFFNTFYGGFKPKYVSTIENNLFFANQKETLQKVHQSITNKKVLATNKSFMPLESEMASSVSITQVVDLFDNKEFRANYPKIAEDYRWVSLQATPQNDFYIFNFISKKQNEKTLSNTIYERFSFTLDTDMIIPPTIVLNHRTKQKEVVIQDEKHNLYLVANNGTLLWKKTLDGKIQSPVFQVDLFKNGYLQMAFTTEHTLWVIDRNGNVVAPFPKKYKGRITPLEVFDYEGNRDYRFLFTEGKNLHLLDSRGQVVVGFALRTAKAEPQYTPKHFRTQQKDYLVFANGDGHFKILHRNGEVRIPVEDTFSFSKNKPLLIDNQFVFTTKSGEMVRVDLQGNVTREQTALSENHFFMGNAHLTTKLSDSLLYMNDKITTLPGNHFSDPKVFRIKGENYVSVIDTLNNKSYLIGQNGKFVEGFPMESESSIDVGVDKDKSIWIATQKSKRTLVVYQTQSLTEKEQ